MELFRNSMKWLQHFASWGIITPFAERFTMLSLFEVQFSLFESFKKKKRDSDKERGVST